VTDDPSSALKIARLCGFLPLALRIAGAKLAAKPHWTLRKLANRLDDEDRRLDELCLGHLNVRADIEANYRNLSLESQRLLRLAGRLGLSELTPWSAAATMAVSERVAEQCLEELFDCHLITAPSHAQSEPQQYVVSDLVRLFGGERSEVEEARAEITPTAEKPAPASAPPDPTRMPATGGDALLQIADVPEHSPHDPVSEKAAEAIMRVNEQRSSLSAVAEPLPTW
jgi:hypothetical protein